MDTGMSQFSGCLHISMKDAGNLILSADSQHIFCQKEIFFLWQILFPQDQCFWMTGTDTFYLLQKWTFTQKNGFVTATTFL